MASAAIVELTREVDGLAGLAAGPERAASCARPRRRIWDVLAFLQSQTEHLGNQSRVRSWFQRCQIQEAIDGSKALQQLLTKLQALDRECCDSQWASTEYLVLASELALLHEQACRLLGVDEEPPLKDAAAALHRREGDGTPSTFGVASAATLPSADDVEEAEKEEDHAHGCAPRPSEKSKAFEDGKPVRFTVDELHDFTCCHMVDGTCEAGCTVGGCQHRIVEDW